MLVFSPMCWLVAGKGKLEEHLNPNDTTECCHFRSNILSDIALAHLCTHSRTHSRTHTYTHTHTHTRTRTHTCMHTQAGEYILRFDNSYSMFTSKTVRYVTEVIEAAKDTATSD